MQTIYFYAPDEIQQKTIQEDQTRWTGYHSNFTPWIAQTYFHLKQTGFSCEIARKMPEEGILLADRDTLDNNYPFLDKVMLICAQSDREYHPSAHLHIVYNSSSWEKDKGSLWNPHLIGHWPMPGLIPRDRKRNSLVENIAYIGTRSQLAPELQSEAWQESLRTLDCRWMPILKSPQWNDYTNLDVIVAARSFDSRNYPNKGSIKLINAWHAGVPAILTPELGFLAERKSEFDFIIARSLEDTIEAINRLKSSPELYQKMVDNGFQRAKEFTIETTLKQWICYFEDIAFPTYQQWSDFNQIHKKTLFTQRYLAFKYSRARDKMNRLVLSKTQ